jgi:PAS domain S-box-containing protein
MTGEIDPTSSAAHTQADLRRIERALRASEERLRQLIASANDAVIMMDEDGLVVDWNPRAEWMFGYSAREAIGARLSELIVPPAYRERHEAGRRRYLHTRQSRLFGRAVEISAVRSDGGELPVELSIWPLESGGSILFGAFIRDISARRAAESALRESEEKYRLVVDNVSEGILIVRDGHIVFANPSAQRLIGEPISALQQLPFTHAIHPDDREMVLDRYRRRLRGEPVEQHYSFRLLRPDGELLWIELAAVPLRWEGQPATLSFITDITERKRLEESLTYSLNERETILENSIVGIAFLNREGRARWVNSAMAQIFRLPREDLLFTSLEGFYADHDGYVATGEAVSEAVHAGRSFEAELRMRRGDGELFWAYLSGRAVNSHDLLQGTVWVVMDITRRKQLEHALQVKTVEQEAILQSTLIGISLLVGSAFQWVNRTLADMFGYPASKLIGEHASCLFAGADGWDAFLDHVRNSLDDRGGYSGEHLLRRRDGGTVWVRLQGTRLDPADPSRGSLWTFVDISEHKRAEAEVRRALEKEKELGALKSRFVAMTSHEFRTPLAGILSSTELLRHYGDRLPADDKRELFEQIESAVARMTSMLDNILLIGRNDAAGQSFAPDAVDFGALCRELAEEVVRAYPAAERPRLRLDIDGLPALLPLDPLLLRQILGNLLSNACKYSPQDAPVDCVVRCVGGQLLLEVVDQGIGIPAEDQQRLFETFHRASNVGAIPGTGLGLAIVKQSVELHGGRIEVDSAPGRGSRFRVSLPLDIRSVSTGSPA